MTRHDPPQGRADGQAPTTITGTSDSLRTGADRHPPDVDFLGMLADRLREQTPPLRKWADTEETAEHLGTTVEHIRTMRKRGEIPGHLCGRLVRYDLVEVDQWLADR